MNNHDFGRIHQMMMHGRIRKNAILPNMMIGPKGIIKRFAGSQKIIVIIVKIIFMHVNFINQVYFITGHPLSTIFFRQLLFLHFFYNFSWLILHHHRIRNNNHRNFNNGFFWRMHGFKGFNSIQFVNFASDGLFPR